MLPSETVLKLFEFAEGKVYPVGVKVRRKDGIYIKTGYGWRRFGTQDQLRAKAQSAAKAAATRKRRDWR